MDLQSTRVPIYWKPSMKENLGSHLPLSPATLHTMLALVDGDKHGYAIMQEVARQADGQFKLGPGTLYDGLARLMEKGLVLEVAATEEADKRRRYYRLTPAGMKVVAAEVKRLEGVLTEAKRSLQAVKIRRA